MAKIILLFILTCNAFFCLNTNAQDASVNDHLYKVWLTPIHSEHIVKGPLYQTTGSGLVLFVEAYNAVTHQVHSEKRFIPYSNIKKISWQKEKNGRIWKLLLIGASGGMIVGGIIGSQAAVNIPAPVGSIAVGITGAFLGSIVGGLVGWYRHPIFIYGDSAHYQKYKEKLNKISYIKQL